MADQIDADWLRQLKEENPGYTAVCYINTTSELKTECDVCVTSSSAPDIIKKLDSDKILFVPDCNLGGWIEKQVPEKDFKMIKGGCPTHLRATKADVEIAKEKHPDALLLVHPECRQEVTEMADYAGSTTGIMNYAKKSDATEFIIGTENSIVQHLQFECPDKKFYPLSKDLICSNMKLTTLGDVYNCVRDCGGEEIELSEDVMAGAKRCIDEMIRLGE